MLPLNWARTPFLSLAVPTGRAIKEAAAIADVFGDQTETIGRDARLVVTVPPDTAAGDGLSLSAVGAAAAPGVVTAIVEQVSGEQALCRILGLVPGLLGGGGVDSDDDVTGETLGASGSGLVRVESADIGFVQQDTSRSITNPVGYAVDDEAVLFDGAGPLDVHPSIGLYAPVWAITGASTVTHRWDATHARLLLEIGLVAGDTVKVAWAVPVPSRFGTWNNGTVQSVLSWCRRGSGTFTVTPRFRTPGQSDVAGAAVTSATLAAWARVGLGYSGILSAISAGGGARLSVYELTVTETAAGAATVLIDATAHARFQSRRRYGT